MLLTNESANILYIFAVDYFGKFRDFQFVVCHHIYGADLS